MTRKASVFILTAVFALLVATIAFVGAGPQADAQDDVLLIPVTANCVEEVGIGQFQPTVCSYQNIFNPRVFIVQDGVYTQLLTYAVRAGLFVNTPVTTFLPGDVCLVDVGDGYHGQLDCATAVALSTNVFVLRNGVVIGLGVAPTPTPTPTPIPAIVATRVPAVNGESVLQVNDLCYVVDRAFTTLTQRRLAQITCSEGTVISEDVLVLRNGAWLNFVAVTVPTATPTPLPNVIVLPPRPSFTG